MVKIRLARFGKKNDPFYRIVAIAGEKKLTGQHLEILGYWHPKKNIKEVKKEEIDKWVAKGAQVSAAVKELMK